MNDIVKDLGINGHSYNSGLDFDLLSRNDVVAGIVGILKGLPPEALPDELQVFLDGGLERTDDETMMKIAVSLVTIARPLYPQYLVPWGDIEVLYALHDEEKALSYGDNPDLEELFDDLLVDYDGSDDKMDESVRNDFRSTRVGSFCLENLDYNRRKLEHIPYCLSEKNANMIAQFLGKDQEEYISGLLNVGLFVQAVLSKWGDHLDRATEKGREANARAISLLGNKIPRI